MDGTNKQWIEQMMGLNPSFVICSMDWTNDKWWNKRTERWMDGTNDGWNEWWMDGWI